MVSSLVQSSDGPSIREAGTGDQEQDGQQFVDNDEEETTKVIGDDSGDDSVSDPFLMDDISWDELETERDCHEQFAPVPSSTSCPICLRPIQFPIRQDCGHVLCWSCLQQSLLLLNDCPLCQAQHAFKAGSNDMASAPESDMRLMGVSHVATGPLPSYMPILSFGMHDNCSNGSIRVNSVMSSIDNASRRHHDISSNPSDVSLQLDNLSDLDGVINFDDLVLPDNNCPSPPIAANTSRSSSFAPRRARFIRPLPRKMNSSLSRHSSSFGLTPTTSAPEATQSLSSQIGKRKARPRKIRRGELAIALMEWATVRTEGIPPDRRYDCGLAIYKSLLIVVGGIVGNLRLNDLHVLDLAAQPSPRWTEPQISGRAPQSGTLLQIFILGDDLYAIGGTIDGIFLNELHRLHLKSNNWKWEKLTVAGTPPSMRYWYSLVVLKAMAILYGGYGHSQRLSDTFALRFDTEQPTWIKLQPRGDSPGPSSTHSVCVVKDRMYIFGGYDGKCRRGQVFAFEIEFVTNERIDCAWRKVETQGHGPASRYTHSGASIGSQLIVYGGNTGILKGDAYVLGLETGEDALTWKLVTCDPPLIPRAWHRAVVYKDAMYVFGGYTAQGNDNNVIRITFKP